MTTPTTTPVAYAPSALNRLFWAVERLPGGGWWVYPLLFLALVVYHHAALWITGSVPVGSTSLAGVPPLAFGPYALGAGHLFIRIGGRSLAAFRPASGLSDADYAIRRYEFLTLPAGRLWAPFLVGAIFGIGSILSAPPSAVAAYGGTGLTSVLVFGAAAIFGYGMSAVSVYFSVRILQRVDRLHREATAIDPFDTAPIYAFSGLTVRLGLAYVLAGYYALFVNSAFQVGNILSLASIVITITLGVACFVLPLWGIHGRLAAAKAVLLRGASLRDQALEAELFRRVDAGNLAGVKEVADALSGIRATGDRIAKLPTWPWPPHVLRGFISAILLPVAVFLITRYVGSQIN
jgi:hypothetical protein